MLYRHWAFGGNELFEMHALECFMFRHEMHVMQNPSAASVYLHLLSHIKMEQANKFAFRQHLTDNLSIQS